MLNKFYGILLLFSFIAIGSLNIAHAITHNVGYTDGADSTVMEIQFLAHVTTANEIVTVDPYQLRNVKTGKYNWIEFYDANVPTAELLFFGADNSTRINTVNVLNSGVPFSLKGYSNPKIYIKTYGTLAAPTTLNTSIRFFDTATPNLRIDSGSEPATVTGTFTALQAPSTVYTVTADVLANIANKLEIMSQGNTYNVVSVLATTTVQTVTLTPVSGTTAKFVRGYARTNDWLYYPTGLTYDANNASGVSRNVRAQFDGVPAAIQVQAIDNNTTVNFEVWSSTASN